MIFKIPKMKKSKENDKKTEMFWYKVNNMVLII